MGSNNIIISPLTSRDGAKLRGSKGGVFSRVCLEGGPQSQTQKTPEINYHRMQNYEPALVCQRNKRKKKHK